AHNTNNITCIVVIHLQCPELLKDVSVIVSDFAYSLLLDQHNLAVTYKVERQEISLLHVYHHEDCKHIVYQTDDNYACSCDYNVQFSLLCCHVLAVHIANNKVLCADYIGARWVILSAVLNITKKENYATNNIIANNITADNVTAYSVTVDNIINNNEFAN
ncbi:9323_t:CDS:1, partial [Cetraspora pellucida]